MFASFLQNKFTAMRLKDVCIQISVRSWQIQMKDIYLYGHITGETRIEMKKLDFFLLYFEEYRINVLMMYIDTSSLWMHFIVVPLFDIVVSYASILRQFSLSNRNCIPENKIMRIILILFLIFVILILIICHEVDSQWSS